MPPARPTPCRCGARSRATTSTTASAPRSTKVWRAPRLAARRARLLRANDDASYAPQFAASTDAAVLLLDLEYALTPDFANLEIIARPRLMPRGGALREGAGLNPRLPKEISSKEALYRNRILFRSQLPAPGPDRPGNRAQWLIDDGYPLQEALSDGIDEIVAALVEDLQARPGTTSTGPALTDGYWRRRGPDGTVDITGRAGTGRSLTAEPLKADAPPAVAPVAIPEPPPEPIAPEESAEPLSDAGALGSPFPPPVVAAPPAPPSPPSPPPPPPAPPVLSYDASPPSLPVSPRMAFPSAASQAWRARVAAALYERPMMSAGVVTQLARGTEVQVRGRTRNTTGEWLFLQVGSEAGWARGEDIEIAR